MTSFIGREREIAEVKRLFAGTRLLTLTGAGGCGKTRLALQVATELLEQFPNGVWWIELAPLTDSGLIPHAVASALGVYEQAGRPIEATLADYLQDKSLLLVLDNCEHLVAGCAQLTDALLRKCRCLRVLATSREALNLAGETAWSVPSLSLPDLRRLPPLERLVEYEAIRLFVERASAARATFTLSTLNMRGVAQICHQLDGIPLAVELAAVRVKVLTVDEIAARLDNRFKLLTGGGRLALPRHQTLRAAMDWSYDLLSEKERIVWRRLAVFSGGWTLAAAEAVCTGEGIEVSDMLGVLTQLVDKSLVVAETQEEEARYRLLETVREYGRDRLVASGEAAIVRRRHRDWYLGLAERAEHELHGPRQVLWRERLATEHDNLRAALQWSKTEEAGAEAELRLAGALDWFWFMQGHWSEGRAWLAGALSRSGDVPSPALPKAIRGAAHLAWRQGDDAQAAELCENGLIVCGELGDREGRAWLLIWLGVVDARQGRYMKAATLFEEAWGLCRELGNKWLTSVALAQLGAVARYQGDYGRAATLHQESYALAKEAGDDYLIAYTLYCLAIVARHQGNYSQAAAYYAESLILCRGDRYVTEGCLEGLAGVACAQGRHEHAARLLGSAEALRETVGLHRPPRAQLTHDRRVALTRAGLGEAAFAKAWAEGRAMAPEEAVEYALARVEVTPASTQGTEKLRIQGEERVLTPREREVAALIARGLTNREISSVLVIAERTADGHVQHILNKLGFNSRAQIAVWAVEHGLHTVSEG